MHPEGGRSYSDDCSRSKHGYEPTAAFIWNSFSLPLGHAAHEIATINVRDRGVRPVDRDDHPTSLGRTRTHPGRAPHNQHSSQRCAERLAHLLKPRYLSHVLHPMINFDKLAAAPPRKANHLASGWSSSGGGGTAATSSAGAGGARSIAGGTRWKYSVSFSLYCAQRAVRVRCDNTCPHVFTGGVNSPKGRVSRGEPDESGATIRSFGRGMGSGVGRNGASAA